MKKIALYTKHPYCSLDGCNGIMESLYPYYKFKLFNERHIEEEFFDDVDMIMFPGGVGDSDKFDRFFASTDKDKIIQNYVKQGGRYIGICMGAYWADKDYFDILKHARASQYIKRPGTDTRRPHPKAIDVTWRGQDTKMFFYDGCSIHGDESQFEVVARYKGNNDPMAIVQGRVGLIGCHLEAEKYWYDKPKYMQKHWNNGYHKLLLKEFVDYIMTK
jgi:glutamine amidotransferase-like uncharacterized protein